MELAERLQRTGSIYESDPQDQLLKSFQKRNHTKFITLLVSDQINIDHYYGDPDHGSLLDFCAFQENTIQFLRTLMSHGANPNVINRMKKKAPMHFIIEKNDVKKLSAFLDFSEVIDINIADNFGNTPLHYVAKGTKSGTNDTTMLKMLLNFPGVNVNATNRKGQTPAHLAASQGNKDSLLLLINSEGIDLETSQDHLGKSAKDIISEKYPDILIPEKPLIALPLTVTPDFIFSLLRANNIAMFKKAIEENGDLINASDGLYTVLQHACDHGLYEIVDILIKLGADPNKTNNSMQYTPIMLAARKGYYRIVQRLIKSNFDISYATTNMETIFHCVVNGSAENSQLGDSDEHKDHLECLNLLLNQTSNREVINRGDSKGNTALHCAGRIGNDDMVFALLDAGSYVGCTNSFEDPALEYLSPGVFEKYLDKCIKTNEKLPREDSYEIIINYNCFVPPSIDKSNGVKESATPRYAIKSNFLSDTELLSYASKSSDLRYLLMHPVIKSLIYLKWYNIRKWFYVNLLFYFVFWALLTVYILGYYDSVKPNRTIRKANETNTDKIDSTHSSKINSMWCLVTTFLFLLIIRELFQFKNAYLRYLKDAENWLELCLIGLTIAILFVNVSEGTKHQLAASAILFSWTELVLLIGKHPALSTHIEMLKTVAWNFLKFLAWYSILIVAFALSFYTLFRNGDSEENKVFIDPGISVFKTIVMLTGEFEAGEIPFDLYPLTSHLLFVLFVFAIAIVLYNLLNGLAVSDTQAIMSDAEMVGYVSRINLVSYVETINLVPFKKLIWGNRTNDWFSCDQTVFSFMIDREIHIYPNNRNIIESSSLPVRKRNEEDEPVFCCLAESCSCKHTIMDSAIVKAAQRLLNRKQEESENINFNHININDTLNEYNRTLKDYKNVLREITESEYRIRTMIQSFNSIVK